MIKRFCDSCNDEIPETANRMTFKQVFEQANGKDDVIIAVEVLVSVNGAANGGEICTLCVQTTVAEGTQSRRIFR